MKNIISLSALFFLFFSSVASAHEVSARLNLMKEPLLEIHRFDEPCTGILYVDDDKDLLDTRDFRHHYCQGRYTLTLEGEANKVVTLYGQFQHGKNRGYLIIRKKDDKPVWLINISQLPGGEWVTFSGDEEYGGYELYFRKAPRFDQNISSVKWGQWWQGNSPS